MTEKTQREPIRLPDEPRDSDVLVIRQQTVYYFLVGVVFFVAGFVVAWVTFTTTVGSANAAEMRSAASAGAREAVRAEMQGLQATVVAQVRQIGAGGGAAGSPPTPSGPINVEVGNSPAWGPEDAKVTIVEFSDFECSFCARFYKDTYGRLKAEFGDQVRFVFKHFPLSFIHPNAERAAVASVCADEQGKFWEYHDVLFQNQGNLGRDGLIQHARTAGVGDIEQFTQCLDTQKYAATVQADLAQGEQIGVSGTPTFFINGRAVVGAQPYDVFAFAIEQALRAAATGSN